jgi:drug/metabolite transporter (DMT)-like permease
VKQQTPQTPALMSAGLQALVAGLLLCVIGLLLGESARWVWTPTALGTLAYLIVFGSCIAYAAYVWLLHNVSPAALGTYAYVNPAVAVVLGWWWLKEELSAMQVAAMFVILVGVVLVTRARPKAIA